MNLCGAKPTSFRTLGFWVHADADPVAVQYGSRQNLLPQTTWVLPSSMLFFSPCVSENKQIQRPKGHCASLLQHYNRTGF